MFPFEFVVEGVPVSANARKKTPALYQAWLAKVRQAAIAAWHTDDLPTREPIFVEIIYFYPHSTMLDVDNLIKPVLDALNKLVYVDDNQVMDVLARKRNMGLPYKFREERFGDLEEKLLGVQEFIYVMIRVIRDLEDLR